LQKTHDLLPTEKGKGSSTTFPLFQRIYEDNVLRAITSEVFLPIGTQSEPRAGRYGNNQIITPKAQQTEGLPCERQFLRFESIYRLVL